MRALLCLPVLLSIGCHSLYDEPAFPGAASVDEIELPPSASPSPSTAPRGADDDVPPPAPRLRRTKTLGVSESPDWAVASRERAAASGAAAPGTTVIVNNTISQVAPSVSYWGPGLTGSTVYGRGAGGPGATTSPAPAQDGRSRGGSGPSPSPPVGGDWPRAPSYGPR